MEIKLEPAHCLCGSAEGELVYQARDRVYHTIDQNFSLIRCDHCQLVYLSPRPLEESVPQIYPKEYFWNQAIEEVGVGAGLEERLSAWYFRRLSERRARFADNLLRITSPPFEKGGLGGIFSSILDVGCGLGGFLSAMKRRGYLNVQGIESDFLGAELKESSFDLITFWHVLEHLHDPAEALKKAGRLLKPGGYLIIGTQNFNSFSRRLMGPAWPLNDVPRHFFHFTRKTLSAVLAQAGFKVEKEWKLTESFPVLGGHFLAPFLIRKDFSLRILPGMLACLALSPFEWIISQAGYGCILTVAARK